MKITKYLLVFITLIIIFFSCNKDEPYTPFDHAGQSIKDEEKLQDFFETHYYIPPATNEQFGELKLIENGETPLTDLVTMKEVTLNDIVYKVYHLKNMPEGVNDSPIAVDSALVNYKGVLLFDNQDDKTVFDKNKNFSFWANLYGSVIPGWTFLLPNFKSGVNTSTQNGEDDISFENTGKGVIFMPSGVAYRNNPTSSIPANSPLIFHVEMAMVNHNDQDKDGIYSLYEDLDGDLNVANDDTDDDNIANFIDFDDDNDGLSTRYENADANEDGNPDDAVDTDGDNTPDYLDNDDDNDGILTKDEDADPNGDGNPNDAKDTDGDNIPDYLDGN